MLDHFLQVIRKVVSVWCYLNRLAVAIAAGVKAKHTEVDRPVVRDAANGLADLPGRNVLERLVIDHALATAGVDVQHRDMIRGEQGAARSLDSHLEVVRLALGFTHSESAILRSVRRSASDNPLGFRLSTVSGSILFERGGGSGLRGGLLSWAICPPVAMNWSTWSDNALAQSPLYLLGYKRADIGSTPVLGLYAKGWGVLLRKSRRLLGQAVVCYWGFIQTATICHSIGNLRTFVANENSLL